MNDSYVTVATYSVPLEAQLAAGRLEDEGIPSIVAGGLAADTFSVGGLGGTVELRVPESDVKKALAILAACAKDLRPEKGWEDEFDPEADVWVCTLCGEAVPLDEEACPSCVTPRVAVQSGTSALAPTPRRRALPANQAEMIQRRDQLTSGELPVPEHELTEEPADLPPAETFLGDDLARRAFRCAIFGILCLPFTLYSLWLQLRLSLFPRELSPFALARLRWTFLLNVGMLFVWTVLLWAGALYWPSVE